MVLPTLCLLLHAHGITKAVAISSCPNYSQAGVTLITYLCIDVLVEGGTSLQLSFLIQEVSMIMMIFSSGSLALQDKGGIHKTTTGCHHWLPAQGPSRPLHALCPALSPLLLLTILLSGGQGWKRGVAVPMISLCW